MSIAGTGPGRYGRVPSAGAVASAFGLQGQVGDLTVVEGAWSNRMYRLVVGGDAFALKEILNPWDLEKWFVAGGAGSG